MQAALYAVLVSCSSTVYGNVCSNSTELHTHSAMEAPTTLAATLDNDCSVAIKDRMAPRGTHFLSTGQMVAKYRRPSCRMQLGWGWQMCCHCRWPCRCAGQHSCWARPRWVLLQDLWCRRVASLRIRENHKHAWHQLVGMPARRLAYVNKDGSCNTWNQCLLGVM